MLQGILSQSSTACAQVFMSTLLLAWRPQNKKKKRLFSAIKCCADKHPVYAYPKPFSYTLTKQAVTTGYHTVGSTRQVLQRAWHMASSASEHTPQNHIYTVKAFMPHYALNFRLSVLGSGLCSLLLFPFLAATIKKTQAKYENIKA